MRVSRFSSDYPSFQFFLLIIHVVNEQEDPIDDFEKKSFFGLHLTNKSALNLTLYSVIHFSFLYI